MAPRGRFITFEGGEGAGKSTQARILGERLRSEGRRIVLTREPGGSPFAEHLRTLILNPQTPAHGALSETLLFYAARADHIAETIKPALAQGRWVISDRFSDSTRVYQGSAGKLDLAIIAKLEEIVVGDTKPDLTIVMDLPPEIGLARAESRLRRNLGARGASVQTLARDSFEARDIDFHHSLRQGFLAVARAEPERCLIVDAELPELDLADMIWKGVKSRLIDEID